LQHAFQSPLKSYYLRNQTFPKYEYLIYLSVYTFNKNTTKITRQVKPLSNLTSVTRDSARGSFFLVAGNILSAVIQAIGVFLLARLLGPDLYGAYTLTLVVPMLFMQLVDLGVSQGLRARINLRHSSPNPRTPSQNKRKPKQHTNEQR
jgi:hypothetical protein